MSAWKECWGILVRMIMHSVFEEKTSSRAMDRNRDGRTHQGRRLGNSSLLAGLEQSISPETEFMKMIPTGHQGRTRTLGWELGDLSFPTLHLSAKLLIV